MALERGWACRRPPPPGAGAEAQSGFVQSHEGPAGGNCARTWACLTSLSSCQWFRESRWKVLTGQSSFTPELWGCGSWQAESRNLAGKPPLHLPAHTSQASSAPGAEWVGFCVETLTPVRSWSGQCLQVMPDEVGLAEGPEVVCSGVCAGPCNGRWSGEVSPMLV